MTKETKQSLLSNNKVEIIGLIGVIGSGKSYRARNLCKNGFIELALANEVKKLAHDLLNMSIPKAKLNSFKDKGNICSVIGDNMYSNTGVRQYYINVGQKLKLFFDNQNIWIDKLIDQIKTEVSKGNTKIVISDIRFENELSNLVKLNIPNYDVKIKIIFCNYKSSRYKILDSDSEKLAQSFINKDFKDGDELNF
jgi:hypothetical protein